MPLKVYFLEQFEFHSYQDKSGNQKLLKIWNLPYWQNSDTSYVLFFRTITHMETKVGRNQ